MREHVDLLDVNSMRAGHPLTSLARLESRRQAWRSTRDLAAYLGLSTEQIRRAARKGVIPHRRRPGAGRYGEIRVRASDFVSAREFVQTINLRTR